MTLGEDAAVTANRALHYLKKMVEDYDRVTNSDEFNGVFVLAHIHGMNYSGPVFDTELLGEVRQFITYHEDYLQSPA
jgi:hypothetical protein